MIASVSGAVAHLSAEAAVVEVGGVGVAVLCTAPDLRGLRVGEQTMLFTSLVVREDSLTLFGFREVEDRDTFVTLLSVSGVGPRLALAVLSALTVDQLRAAVHSNDEAVLVRVPGIGRKGAQRMVLDLADKLAAPVATQIDVRQLGASAAAAGSWQSPVREALISLGWSSREADEVIASIADQEADHSDLTDSALVSKMLALALRGMGSR